MHRVVFRASALEQVVKAKAWYDRQRSGLGAEFARSLESAVARVARNPFAAPIVHHEVRRTLVKRFPYSVFYTLEGDTPLVLS